MKPQLRPLVLTPLPSALVVLLGGIVATILLTAWLFAAPVLGLPLVDIPHAIGAVLTGRSDVAFAIGYALFFIGAAGACPLLMLALWSLMPGSQVGLAGAIRKSAVWGVAVWLVTGSILGIASAVGRSGGATFPGWFATSTGLAGAMWFFAGCLAYAIALAVIASVEHGIATADTLGWAGYYHAATGPKWLDEHRSLDPHEPSPPAGPP